MSTTKYLTVTERQHDALSYLADQPAKTRAVANWLGTTMAAGHNVLNNLAAKGMVRSTSLGPFQGLQWEPTERGLRAIGDIADFRLTEFQAEEVQGLLDVCHDNQVNGDRDRPPWGRLDGHVLTVTDRGEATAELRYRAEHLLSEGQAVGKQTTGMGSARSLNDLADKVAKLGPAALARMFPLR